MLTWKKKDDTIISITKHYDLLLTAITSCDYKLVIMHGNKELSTFTIRAIDEDDAKNQARHKLIDALIFIRDECTKSLRELTINPKGDKNA